MSCEVLQSLWNIINLNHIYKQTLVEKKLKVTPLQGSYTQSADDKCAVIYSFEDTIEFNNYFLKFNTKYDVGLNLNGNQFNFDSDLKTKISFDKESEEKCLLPLEQQYTNHYSVYTDFKNYIQANSWFNSTRQSTLSTFEFNIIDTARAIFKSNAYFDLYGNCQITENSVNCKSDQKSSLENKLGLKLQLLYKKYLEGKHELNITETSVQPENPLLLNVVVDPVAKSFGLNIHQGHDQFKVHVDYYNNIYDVFIDKLDTVSNSMTWLKIAQSLNNWNIKSYVKTTSADLEGDVVDCNLDHNKEWDCKASCLAINEQAAENFEKEMYTGAKIV